MIASQHWCCLQAVVVAGSNCLSLWRIHICDPTPNQAERAALRMIKHLSKAAPLPSIVGKGNDPPRHRPHDQPPSGALDPNISACIQMSPPPIRNFGCQARFTCMQEVSVQQYSLQVSLMLAFLTEALHLRLQDMWTIIVPQKTETCQIGSTCRCVLLYHILSASEVGNKQNCCCCMWKTWQPMPFRHLLITR